MHQLKYYPEFFTKLYMNERMNVQATASTGSSRHYSETIGRLLKKIN